MQGRNRSSGKGHRGYSPDPSLKMWDTTHPGGCPEKHRKALSGADFSLAYAHAMPMPERWHSRWPMTRSQRVLRIGICQSGSGSGSRDFVGICQLRELVQYPSPASRVLSRARYSAQQAFFRASHSRFLTAYSPASSPGISFSSVSSAEIM